MSITSIRRWHSYFGLFIAPSVLLFALTGAVQLFNLHEAHGNYRPPAMLEKLSSIHKDQVFAPGHHHEPAQPQAGSQNPAGAAEDDDKAALPTLLLKVFFLLVALSLAISTTFGLWIGLTQTRQKRLAWTLVLTGTLVPMALLLF